LEPIIFISGRKGEDYMVYQNNGIEITYKEVEFLQTVMKEENLRNLSKSYLKLKLRKQLSVQEDAETRDLSLLINAMAHDEFEDFKEFLYEAVKPNKRIPIMQPFYGKNANIIYVVPMHCKNAFLSQRR